MSEVRSQTQDFRYQNVSIDQAQLSYCHPVRNLIGKCRRAKSNLALLEKLAISSRKLAKIRNLKLKTLDIRRQTLRKIDIRIKIGKEQFSVFCAVLFALRETIIFSGKQAISD